MDSIDQLKRQESRALLRYCSLAIVLALVATTTLLTRPHGHNNDRPNSNSILWDRTLQKGGTYVEDPLPTGGFTCQTTGDGDCAGPDDSGCFTMGSGGGGFFANVVLDFSTSFSFETQFFIVEDIQAERISVLFRTPDGQEPPPIFLSKEDILSTGILPSTWETMRFEWRADVGDFGTLTVYLFAPNEDPEEIGEVLWPYDIRQLFPDYRASLGLGSTERQILCVINDVYTSPI